MDAGSPRTPDAAWPSGRGEMAQRVREHDWSATPLGPSRQWSASLRTAVQIVLAHPLPAIVLWGRELIQLYNDAYRDLMGVKHPAGLGQPTRECWSEVWHLNAPIYARVWQGESVSLEDALFPITRSGRLEDAWFSLTYSPVRDEADCVAGVLVTIIETTRRLRAEAAQRHGEARLAMIFERALVGLSEIAPDGRFVRVNPELARIVSRSCEALLNLTIADVTHPEDVARSLEAAASVLAQGGSATLEKRYRRPDGTLVVAQSSLTRLDAQAGGEPRLLAVTVDLTARRQAEEALRQSEERLQLAMNVGELAAWDWDISTGRIVWSREHFRMQGYAVGDVEPSYEAWLARIHPDDRAVAETALRQAREQGEAYNHEFRTLLPDGSVHWMSAQGLFFRDVQGQPYRMVGVMRDITEQRNIREMLEHQIRERTQVLRQLLVRVEQVQDEERRRIARELHDGLGQYLTSISLALGMLRDAGDAAKARHELQRLQALMQQMDQELDRTVFLLRPTALEDGGLGEAVVSHVRTWSELTGVTADLEILGLDHDRLSPQVEAAVFRVVQEALTNVAKHARATRVSVALERRRAQLVAVIEDDGIGFEPQEVSTSAGHLAHWGLLGMQERIEALGGSFTIESHAEQGTSVLLRVPLS